MNAYAQSHEEELRPPSAPVGAMMEGILAEAKAQAPEGEIDCPIAPKELPKGHRLRNYMIRKTLGAGGFGVTYLALEDELERHVVIKEHFPHSICHRESSSLRICLNDPSKEESFNWALQNFMREARLLAGLDHPHIMKLFNYFEWKGIAYYVSEYIDGQSITDVARSYVERGQKIPQGALYGTLIRLLDALDYIHKRDILHRDIKPDNILVTKQGMPVLIDFGAAREEHGDACTPVVESMGFSPSEQSSPNGNMGPWTDLYALGATMYFILTGECLPVAKQRELFDTVDPLTENAELVGQYHIKILASIDRALSPKIENRYHKVSEWMDDLRI